MFNLTSFDAEIHRRQQIEAPGDDMLLAQELRGPLDETGVTTMGRTSGAVLGALAVFSVSMQLLIGTSATDSMTYNGMNQEEFALHMNMSHDDPRLIEIFEETGMV